MTIEALLQNKEAHPHLSGRAIIVDEAGMVSGRQTVPADQGAAHAGYHEPGADGLKLYPFYTVLVQCA
jgi:hypothetical protein